MKANPITHGVQLPADVAALDGQYVALHTEREALAAELAQAEAKRAELDGVLTEDDGADAAYVSAAAVVRSLRRKLAALDQQMAEAGAALKTAQIAALRAEEAADADDREAVERTLIHAADVLAAYEARLKDRWCRRNELGLRMPSRLDAIPGRIVHRLAAAHFGRFGLASGMEGKRL